MFMNMEAMLQHTKNRIYLLSELADHLPYKLAFNRRDLCMILDKTISVHEILAVAS